MIWMIQTPIHEKIEKVKDLLRGPTIFRYSQLYSYKLNLKLQQQKILKKKNSNWMKTLTKIGEYHTRAIAATIP
jgi:hypothetical protein